MKAAEVRQSFLDFFASKQHRIVPSAPMVVKNDPTLMFTNAGMNQFKEIFLGNSPIVDKRVANSQKCLRVSGKHNDLEEVGHDTYHHTMFEMLGNWSFGDYFKQEAIDWAWEYLTEVLKIDKSRLYATVFEGYAGDGLERDNEAYNIWLKHLPADHIIDGNKKDNFWEMGESGPCGPCSEIHIDLRDDDEIALKPGRELVNNDHPQVIEIWNNVFIQYNRKASGELEQLPSKHVDTGMGFERLVRVLQGKKSNYDTDIFTPIIAEQERLTNIKYGSSTQTDVAMRVVSDHIRTIAFAIADGQLPSNNKAGYVIRRILRRAVRYAYTFLGSRESYMYRLIPALVACMGDAYPELKAQQELITKVMKEEEESFLRTLETGISLLNKIITETRANGGSEVSGKVAFELYDTFGFPLDLTELILKENELTLNRGEFETEMEAQKQRARNATAIQTDDWVVLKEDEQVKFIGYDHLQADIIITRYRKITAKNKEQYQLVFNVTPFYAESGGQVGDTGTIANANERIDIIDTKKENNLIVHIANALPENPAATFVAKVDADKRLAIARHHSVTHLLHKALREILGTHVEQKGSLVHADHLRFDFSHFQKVNEDEIVAIEKRVNQLIRENAPLHEGRETPIEKAREMGAMALFGEKYGDVVRTIGFGNSVELCGGTHVQATGQIGYFKITGESSISAGVRRIEAVAGHKAEEFVYGQENLLRDLHTTLKNPSNLKRSVEVLQEENSALSRELDQLRKQMIAVEKQTLLAKAMNVNGTRVVVANIDPMYAGVLKDFAFQLRGDAADVVAVLGVMAGGNPQIAVIISEETAQKHDLNASLIIREAAKEIQGGGGGQPFFATAGGKNPAGLDQALAKAGELIKAKL
ncbi:alanyl-tRNA synthetase [Breznakibacter xylanolyticus]|uniref:Alanine--tRNA ligase n=1 Tax=Breznakibacter xylanolyticus TaxID=990 RepID=A0A2W7P5W7_9BACT|nr:alanine--tRNA ligase [Breznakibacter xylanolyticus]PZX20756.1 alanyl-tRNA synthetase [Breznakibacter xylanolyticus]